MGIRKCIVTNNLQEIEKGREFLKRDRKTKDIRVNLHFDSAGEPLQKIIERNVRIVIK